MLCRGGRADGGEDRSSAGAGRSGTAQAGTAVREKGREDERRAGSWGRWGVGEQSRQQDAAAAGSGCGRPLSALADLRRYTRRGAQAGVAVMQAGQLGVEHVKWAAGAQAAQGAPALRPQPPGAACDASPTRQPAACT